MYYFIILALSFAFVFSPISAQATTLINNNLTELDAGTNIATFYTANNPQSSNTTHFGAYVFHGVGDTLYIGLANYRPADAGSALLAKYNGSSISFIGNLDEEGVNEIVSYNGAILVGGADPHDSWALGNVYSYSNSVFSKIRTGNGLTNVIHMWGLDVASDGTTYAAVSSHDGTFPGVCVNGVSCFGEVFSSTNFGQTWTSLGHLGAYRVFDIDSWNNKLYALYVDDVVGDNRLAVSSDNGQNWTTLKSDGGLRRTHLTEFLNSLVFLGGGTSTNVIYTVNASNSITQYSLPFSVGIAYGDATHFSNYNQFVVGSDNFLYTISSAGDIWRTDNLTDWTQVTESSTEYISIGYWSNPNKLLVSTRGASAKIYTIDLDDNYGALLQNVPASIDVKDVSTGLSAETASALFTAPSRTIRVSNTSSAIISDIQVDLSENRDWSSIQVGSDREAGRSYVTGLTVAPGASTTHTLYIPIPANSDATTVRICPQATTIEAVDYKCTEGVNFAESETKTVGGSSVTLSKATLDGKSYWKAVGVTGTGGIDISSRTTSSSDQHTDTKTLDVSPLGGATLERYPITVIVSEGTVAEDAEFKMESIQPQNSVRLSSYWLVGTIVKASFHSLDQDARILTPAKPSILTLYLSNPAPFSIRKDDFILAYSQDMEKWKALNNNVVDRNNSSIATVTHVNGYYAVFARLKSRNSSIKKPSVAEKTTTKKSK